jgi:ketosteroid isomerase-like protein
MSAITGNKAILEHVFAETAKGNGGPFVEALADDVSWTIVGTTAWSKTYSGKRAVLKELLGPLNAQLESGNFVTASRFIAEGDVVVVEGQGHNTTKTGKAYRNRYCWLFSFREGKVVSLVEYADTALIEAALQAPEASQA